MKYILIIVCSLTVCLLTGCASTASTAPDLQAYQSPALPTAGSDAALSAHQMY